MYNKIVLIGNLVRDCETKTVKSTSVSRFRLAVDDSFKKDSPVYIDVEAWDKQSEFCEKWLKKGKGVIVDGRLCMDSWEKDGKKESKLYVKAQDIRFSNVAKSQSEDETAEKPSKTTDSKSVSKSVSNPQQEQDEFSDVPF
jgi:single-strand DNA-binding protein